MWQYCTIIILINEILNKVSDLFLYKFLWTSYYYYSQHNFESHFCNDATYTKNVLYIFIVKFTITISDNVNKIIKKLVKIILNHYSDNGKPFLSNLSLLFRKNLRFSPITQSSVQTNKLNQHVVTNESLFPLD